MATLHKILESDRERIVRLCYAEDPDLINLYHQGAGNGLDTCVKITLDNTDANSNFYKVEAEDGTLAGYFAQALPVGDIWVLNGFTVRKQFRTPTYLSAFWELVRSTFENEFYTSVSENNYRGLAHLLKNNFNIVNKTVAYGKIFVILKSPKII